MNHREIDIENIKQWLRNRENRMKKYYLYLIDIPERGYGGSLWEAIFEKLMAKNSPELKKCWSSEWCTLNTQQNK